MISLSSTTSAIIDTIMIELPIANAPPTEPIANSRYSRPGQPGFRTPSRPSRSGVLLIVMPQANIAIAACFLPKRRDSGLEIRNDRNTARKTDSVRNADLRTAEQPEERVDIEVEREDEPRRKIEEDAREEQDEERFVVQRRDHLARILPQCHLPLRRLAQMRNEFVRAPGRNQDRHEHHRRGGQSIAAVADGIELPPRMAGVDMEKHPVARARTCRARRYQPKKTR